MSTTAPAAPVIQVPLAEIFRTEITEAKRLGYRMQSLLTHEVAVVRLVPTTQQTMRLARDNNSVALESTVVYEDAGERLDAIRLAIAAVTQMARDAAA